MKHAYTFIFSDTHIHTCFCHLPEECRAEIIHAKNVPITKGI
uniref:Uncharacterized protein n=1 Tax=Rhizophora mucronata TaxID=61149 RepID=A0A2P2PAX0_RHIMU